MATYHTTISSKGQVVVPAELREQLGLKKGTRATWNEDRGRLILTPITERILDEIQGFLKPRRASHPYLKHLSKSVNASAVGKESAGK